MAETSGSDMFRRVRQLAERACVKQQPARRLALRVVATHESGLVTHESESDQFTHYSQAKAII